MIFFFDGILTDIGLPDGNGCDFVKWISKNHPDNTAIIYVYSAFSINYIEEKIKGLPVKGYFPKPYFEKDMKDFVAAVEANKRNVAKEKDHFN
ncbi:MAG: response regulator [Gammaproteobacteria bacterium]|nr:response regulator [Gammaproteobacteria bacterium]MCD8542914.1 response regulator [Gammaproteobacteria bacterium]